VRTQRRPPGKECSPADVFVQDAWARGQDISVHGWVYSLANGLVKDLNLTVSRPPNRETRT